MDTRLRGSAPSGFPLRVLVADPDDEVRRVLPRMLEELGCDPIVARDGHEAVRLAGPDLLAVCIDSSLPGPTARECLEQLREKAPYARRLLLAAESTALLEALIGEHQGELLCKPVTMPTVRAALERAIADHPLFGSAGATTSAADPNSGEPRLLAVSRSLREALQRADRIAASDSTALIRGESGVGKTSIAKRIHCRSRRATGPFVVVNCAALPHALIESELFGHTSGAFTGAVRDRPGRVESADGGTLFLDEIGDLPLALQPKLLSLLQDRTFQRPGEDRDQQVDVRVIAATHQDLHALREQKRFRDDLYFRLNVLRLDLPPLRERPEEIPPLAAEILRRIAERDGAPPASLAPDALRRLEQHGWSGNVRELENVLERAVCFRASDPITAADIEFDDPCHTPTGALDLQPPVSPTGYSIGTLAEIESRAVRDALRQSDGNRARAAELLGISPRSIYNKIRRYGVDE